MKKVIRDGEVAVLYSPGYGAGWYTWGVSEAGIFHPELIELVEADHNEKITKELMTIILPDEDEPYLGGSDDLCIYWIKEGTKFYISEYDGSETITTEEEHDWLIA